MASLVGSRVERKEDGRFLQGKGRYTADINIANQTYAVFVRSPHARAKIKSVDTSKALKSSGVVGVLTGKEIAEDKIGGLIAGWAIRSEDGSEMKVPANPPLAKDVANFVGEPVAVVFAETLDEAKEGAEKVKVDYKVLKAVVDPADAMKTNILGTKNVSETAIKYKTKIMVLISTDKAVDPTNFMGASKRAAEIYIQNLDKENSITNFVTVRFGNVLGSTGSVIPLFQKQIKRGGPLKVTHKDTTRFFMSVKEAVELVLISLSSSVNKKERGYINVLEMGEPMKIDNLAKQLARLSGLTPGKDIEIIYTGLRTGEKLHEKLFHQDIQEFHWMTLSKILLKE